MLAMYAAQVSLPYLIPIQAISLPPRRKIVECTFSSLPISLVLAARCLTRLELVQVPPANCQTTLVLVHALAEALNIIRART